MEYAQTLFRNKLAIIILLEYTNNEVIAVTIGLKEKIVAGIAGAVILGGGITGGVLLAGNNTDTAQSSSLPASSTSEESIMSSDITAVDVAVTSELTQNNNTSMDKQQSDTSKTPKTTLATSAAITSTAEASSGPKTETTAINISQNFEGGTFTIKSVMIDYSNRVLMFENEPIFNDSLKYKSLKYTSTDKNGNELQTSYDGKEIWIGNTSSIDNLSTVNLTCYINDIPPFVVKIDVPIE